MESPAMLDAGMIGSLVMTGTIFGTLIAAYFVLLFIDWRRARHNAAAVK